MAHISRFSKHSGGRTSLQLSLKRLSICLTTSGWQVVVNKVGIPSTSGFCSPRCKLCNALFQVQHGRDNLQT